MSTEPARVLSPEEYLAFERQAETRHEYHDGRVFAMVGASERHNLIVVNLVYALRRELQGRPCRVYASDMRLRVTATGLYTYPDVSALCGTPHLEDELRDTLLNPDVLIEVLSPSTERYDRGRKAEHYRTIPSLAEYLFVSQDQPRVERFRRAGEREWLLSEAIGVAETIELAALACSLSLRDVYEQIFTD